MRAEFKASFTQPDAISQLRARELTKYDLRYFQTEHWKEDLPGHRGNGDRSYDDPEHAQRFGLIATTLSQSIQFDSVLDVGCGPGHLLKALSKTSARLAGVDAAEAALDLATVGDQPVVPDSRAELRLAICTSLPFTARSFDVVMSLDVLEHLLVFDIEQAINELVRVCRKHLIVTINSDNPYLYHPTILSPDTWRALFAVHEGMEVNSDLEKAFAEGVVSHRDEYTFYCYSVRDD